MVYQFRTALTVAILAASSMSAQQQRAVLVTGASSGIGRAIAEKLAANGYFVYAGARSPKDIDALNHIPNVKGVRLDVTDTADIRAAVQTVTSAGRGLYGVVNNAGILVIAPLIEADEKDVKAIFDVNVFGAFRVTKAFAPLLIKSKGRVINISSLNGIVAQPIIGAYSMVKHATEAYSDALRAELGPLGVGVSAIEPGNFGTEIGRSALAHLDTTKLDSSLFARQMRGTINSMKSFDKNPPPDLVAETALRILNSDKPKPRYLAVPVQGQAAVVVRRLIDELVQLNSDQPFAYSRDDLVKMLDAALSASSAPRG